LHNLYSNHNIITKIGDVAGSPKKKNGNNNDLDHYAAVFNDEPTRILLRSILRAAILCRNKMWSYTRAKPFNPTVRPGPGITPALALAHPRFQDCLLQGCSMGGRDNAKLQDGRVPQPGGSLLFEG
jgi:hypothetical protein